jgi:hypothetical protein
VTGRTGGEGDGQGLGRCSGGRETDKEWGECEGQSLQYNRERREKMFCEMLK